MYRYLGDTGLKMYYLINNLSVFVLMVFNFFQFNKKKLFLGGVSVNYINRKETDNKVSFRINLCTVLEITIISLTQCAFISVINSCFGDLLGTNTNYFGRLLTAPIVVFIVCFILNINYSKTLDLITPGYPLSLIFSKLACFCAGCCRGIECSFGMYNHKTNAVEFPSQLLEAALALIIFFILLHCRKKAKEGTMYPTYLILYSSTRFFSEFLREESNVLGPLKTYHLLCLAGIAIGVFGLFVAKKHTTIINDFSDKLFKAIGVKANDYAIKIGLKKNKNIIHHKKRKKK